MDDKWNEILRANHRPIKKWLQAPLKSRSTWL